MYKVVYFWIMRNQWKIYIEVAIAIICLFVGGVIYLLFRTRTLVMFRIMPAEILNKLNIISLGIDIPNNKLTSFVVYNLPTCLWLISYLFIMRLICCEMSKNQRLIWLYALPIILLLIEFLQISPSFPGTFDLIDVLMYIIPITISLLIDKIYEKL